MIVDNDNEVTKKTREDRAQYEHKTQNKTIEHRSSSGETMAREAWLAFMSMLVVLMM